MSSSEPGPGSTTSDGNVLPDYVSTLEHLVPLATAIATAGSNPKAWLEDFIFRKIGEWVVGGILNGTQFVLGWIIFAYERTTSILIGVIPQLQAPFTILENAVVGVIETIYGAAIGVAQTAGLAGPPATAFATVLIGTVLFATAWGILKVIPGSDFVEGAAGAFRR
ncbi:hypothetical protein [Halobellus ordinarius]|uniref:hypothetical protein n=1 Tax=Halobellus ordinarius TaxID=3075120 RepID=UPI0028800C3A|nr:hypothetical protein [Halobellus sp. ZY16]